jgi:hypothetical protein
VTGASLRVVLAVIQAFTKVGFGAQCLGFAALASAMWVPGKSARLAAVVCVACSLAPIALIAFGDAIGRTQLAEMLAFLAAWGIIVAAMLASGSLRDP